MSHAPLRTEDSCKLEECITLATVAATNGTSIMGDETRFIIVNSETGEQAGWAEEHDQDVFFPDELGGWKHVLDCRHSPYTGHSLEHNCELAGHVRKSYILVDPDDFDALSESMVDEEAPSPSSEHDDH